MFTQTGCSSLATAGVALMLQEDRPTMACMLASQLAIIQTHITEPSCMLLESWVVQTQRLSDCYGCAFPWHSSSAYLMLQHYYKTRHAQVQFKHNQHRASACYMLQANRPSRACMLTKPACSSPRTLCTEGRIRPCSNPLLLPTLLLVRGLKTA